MRKAKARNLVGSLLEPAGELPVHFVTVDGSRVSLVWVRRLKYPGYTVAEIDESCKRDSAELRSITVTAEIFRELRVRGPDRRWYRYLVLPASVVVMEARDDPGDGEETEEEKKPVNPDEVVESAKNHVSFNGPEPAYEDTTEVEKSQKDADRQENGTDETDKRTS
jgi:hypothetical protein